MRAILNRCQRVCGVRALRSARLALAFGGVLLAGAIATGSAAAEPTLKEQAVGIMRLNYHDFSELRSSPAKEPRFDWASDGCSGPHTNPVDWLAPFYAMHNAPCLLHDFGYRNFGNGLRLERTESRREWIDGRFLTEMLRNCDDHWWYWGCETSARGFYAAVRVASDWSS